MQKSIDKYKWRHYNELITKREKTSSIKVNKQHGSRQTECAGTQKSDGLLKGNESQRHSTQSTKQSGQHRG